MKTKLFALLLILPMFAFCTPDNVEPNGPDTEQQDTTQTPPADTTQQESPTPPSDNVITPEEPQIELPTEIKNGDRVLACNPNVEKFLTEVTYPDRDYSYTKIMEYYGGYNGMLGEGETVKSDKPSEYSIRWEANEAAGKLTLRLEDTTWGWSAEESINAGSYYVNITNLCPNAHYTYSVKGEDGTVMTEGEFDTYGSIHQVYFKHSVRNARDMGGWKTYDGTKMVKYRQIYRGGRLETSTISKSGKTMLLNEGIRAQLDIRSDSDWNTEPTLPELEFCAPNIKTGGDSMLKQDGGEKTRMCMQFIIDCLKENKPVYFHCSLGRDRTGTLGMIILGLLDVVEGDISKEYEVTYFSPRGWSIATSESYTKFQNYRTKWAYAPAAEYIWEGKYPNNTYTFNDDVNSPDYDKFSVRVEKYLLDIGISQEDIDAYREMMLIDVPAAE